MPLRPRRVAAAATPADSADRELNLHEDATLDAALVDMASEMAQEARRLAADDPDLRTD